MDKAAAGGHFEVILFLHTKRSEGCTMDAAANANRNEHVEILQWFFRFYTRMIHREKDIVFSKRYNYYLIDWLHPNYQASGERTVCVGVIFNLPTSRSTRQIQAQECVSSLP
ncbi:hypothetical protein PI124_g8361 [Phytophthora idaei]|nr:hypothetical protein PI125_g5249 [Phytophthora idaei]KAG3164609.1 hypothetical protein PI126_g5047 [Phytophthora idaei]KAG3246929.1 hypothetical protein PI124_g8361 [Phytophthora idaei]